jgi:hypothetical protein
MELENVNYECFSCSLYHYLTMIYDPLQDELDLVYLLLTEECHSQCYLFDQSVDCRYYSDNLLQEYCKRHSLQHKTF